MREDERAPPRRDLVRGRPDRARERGRPDDALRCEEAVEEEDRVRPEAVQEPLGGGLDRRGGDLGVVLGRRALGRRLHVRRPEHPRNRDVGSLVRVEPLRLGRNRCAPPVAVPRKFVGEPEVGKPRRRHDPIGEPGTAVAGKRIHLARPAEFAQGLTAAAGDQSDVGAAQPQRLRDHRLIGGMGRPVAEGYDQYPRAVPSGFCAAPPEALQIAHMTLPEEQPAPNGAAQPSRETLPGRVERIRADSDRVRPSISPARQSGADRPGLHGP